MEGQEERCTCRPAGEASLRMKKPLPGECFWCLHGCPIPQKEKESIVVFVHAVRTRLLQILYILK